MIYRENKQVIDTYTQTHAMTIPEVQNWPRVKTYKFGERIIKYIVSFIDMKFT